MKSITHTFDTMEDIRIIPIGDLHIGDKHSSKQIIKDLVDKVQNDPNCYCVLMGDLIDNATTYSVGDTYDAELSPMDQLKVIRDLMMPIRQKILGIIEGNHEERTTRQTGIRMMELLSLELGINDRYSSTSLVIFLKFGHQNFKGSKRVYTIYCNHGSGGGRRPGAKINRLSDYSNILDADAFFVAHSHFPAIFKDKYFRPRTNLQRLECVDRLYVNTASALDYGGYGDRGGFTPGSNAYPIVKFSATERNMTAEL